MNIQVLGKRNDRKVILWGGVLRAIAIRIIVIVPTAVVAWRVFDGTWIAPQTVGLLTLLISLFFTTTLLLSTRRVPLDSLPELKSDRAGDAP